MVARASISAKAEAEAEAEATLDLAIASQATAVENETQCIAQSTNAPPESPGAKLGNKSIPRGNVDLTTLVVPVALPSSIKNRGVDSIVVSGANCPSPPVAKKLEGDETAQDEGQFYKSFGAQTPASVPPIHQNTADISIATRVASGHAAAAASVAAESAPLVGTTSSTTILSTADSPVATFVPAAAGEVATGVPSSTTSDTLADSDSAATTPHAAVSFSASDSAGSIHTVVDVVAAAAIAAPSTPIVSPPPVQSSKKVSLAMSKPEELCRKCGHKCAVAPPASIASRCQQAIVRPYLLCSIECAAEVLEASRLTRFGVRHKVSGHVVAPFDSPITPQVFGWLATHPTHEPCDPDALRLYQVALLWAVGAKSKRGGGEMADKAANIELLHTVKFGAGNTCFRCAYPHLEPTPGAGSPDDRDPFAVGSTPPRPVGFFCSFQCALISFVALDGQLLKVELVSRSNSKKTLKGTRPTLRGAPGWLARHPLWRPQYQSRVALQAYCASDLWGRRLLAESEAKRKRERAERSARTAAAKAAKAQRAVERKARREKKLSTAEEKGHETRLQQHKEVPREQQKSQQSSVVASALSMHQRSREEIEKARLLKRRAFAAATECRQALLRQARDKIDSHWRGRGRTNRRKARLAATADAATRFLYPLQQEGDTYDGADGQRTLEHIRSPVKVSIVGMDSRKCALCAAVGDALPACGGRLLNLGLDSWIHVSCALWSAEVIEEPPPYGIGRTVGFSGTGYSDIFCSSSRGGNSIQLSLLHGVHKAILRGQNTVCVHCSNPGATVSCHQRNCPDSAHFPCAAAAGWAFCLSGDVRCPGHKKTVPATLAAAASSLVTDHLVARPVHVVRDEKMLLTTFLSTWRGKKVPDNTLPPALRVGSLVMRSLGEVVHDRPGFHDRNMIYPAGFVVQRHFWDAYRWGERCVYNCSVLEEANHPPLFQLTADHPDLSGLPSIIRAASPQQAWEAVFVRLSATAAAEATPAAPAEPFSPDGTALFGFVPLVRRWIESLPGAGRCSEYRFHALLSRVPTGDDFQAGKKSLGGCARATVFDRRAHLRRIASTLTAMTGESETAAAALSTALSSTVHVRGPEAAPSSGEASLSRTMAARGDGLALLPPSKTGPVVDSCGVNLAASAAFSLPSAKIGAFASTFCGVSTSSSTTPLPLFSSRPADAGKVMRICDPISALRFRKLHQLAEQRTRVQKSGIAGWGLYACAKIPEGDMVIEYVGEVVRRSISDARETTYNSQHRGCYMFGLGDERFVVDATLSGNTARFINHSCDPNCYSRIVYFEDTRHIVIFSKRTIYANEELSYDYKFAHDAADKVPCACGARLCTGWMN